MSVDKSAREADALAAALDMGLRSGPIINDLNLANVLAKLDDTSPLRPSEAERSRVWQNVAYATDRRRAFRFVRPSLLAAAAAAILVIAVSLTPVARNGLTTNQAGAESLLMQEGPGGEVVTALKDESSDRFPINVDSFGAMFLDWSPDGRDLLYVYQGDLWLWSEGTEPRNLTNTPERIEGFPRWSPRGDSIAFASRPFISGEEPERLLEGPGVLTFADRSGANYRSLGNRTLTTSPSWSNDGRAVAYSSGGIIYIFDLDSGMERAIRGEDLGLPSSTFLNGPVWSPSTDEFAVAYSLSNREPTRSETIQGAAPVIEQGYLVIDMVGMVASKILAYEGSVNLGITGADWSRSGDRLFLPVISPPASGNPSGLWLYDRGSHALRQIHDGPMYQAAFSPSGRYAAFVDRTYETITLVDLDSGRVTHQHFEQAIQGIAWRPLAD